VTCEELVRSLSDYIDGTLAAEARADADEHVASCPDCHLVLDTTRCTTLLYRAAASPALTGERRARLLARLERACRDRGSKGSDPRV
jgi:anti-sigma factor RsiW